MEESNSKATIGVEFQTQSTIIEEKEIKSQIVGTIGLEKFRVVTSIYYHDAVGALIVYVVNRRTTFDEVKNYISAFIKLDDSRTSTGRFFLIRKHKFFEALDMIVQIRGIGNSEGDKTMAWKILNKEPKYFKLMTQVLIDNNFREIPFLCHIHQMNQELPEAALGINFARDGLNRKDWVSLVTVYSDSWFLVGEDKQLDNIEAKSITRLLTMLSVLKKSDRILGIKKICYNPRPAFLHYNPDQRNDGDYWSCRDALLIKKYAILNWLMRILESQRGFSKETACFALKNLTLVKEDAILVGSRGGIGTLLEICWSGTPSAVAEAVRVLRNLATIRELQQKFLEEGEVLVLIGVLKYRTVMARENSMECLCNLTGVNDELSIKVAIFKEGVLDCVMDYMEGNQNLQLAIALLRNLGFLKRKMGCSFSGMNSIYSIVNENRFKILRPLGSSDVRSTSVFPVKEILPTDGARSSTLTANKSIDTSHFSDDGTYALKKVLIHSEEQLELVREEIRVSSLFNHSNLLPLLVHAIIAVKDVQGGSQYHEAYLLFPIHMDGTLLDNTKDMKIKKEFFPTLTVRQIFRQLCAGLMHMHNFDPPYAHNDVKPGNVLITHKKGQSPGAILMDFGCMRSARKQIRLHAEALQLQEWAAEHSSALFWAPELWVRVIFALDNSDSGTIIEAAKAISAFNGKSIKETGENHNTASSQRTQRRLILQLLGSWKDRPPDELIYHRPHENSWKDRPPDEAILGRLLECLAKVSIFRSRDEIELKGEVFDACRIIVNRPEIELKGEVFDACRIIVNRLCGPVIVGLLRNKEKRRYKLYKFIEKISFSF